DARGHEVVTLVAQHADDLGGERLVQHPDDGLTVGAVVLGDGALLDVPPCALAQLADVREKGCVAGRVLDGTRFHRGLLAHGSSLWCTGSGFGSGLCRGSRILRGAPGRGGSTAGTSLPGSSITGSCASGGSSRGTGGRDG